VNSLEQQSTHKELLWNRWQANADKTPDKDAIVWWSIEEEPYRWTFASLVETAEKFAEQLKEHGIKEGEVCAIIIRHNKFFYPVYLAVSCIGAIPAVLAYPNSRLHPDKFRQGIEGMSQRSGLDWILTERDLEPVIRPLTERTNSTIKGLHFPLEWPSGGRLSGKNLEHVLNVRNSLDGNSPFLLQHSSGTTGLQKPVLLSHRAVLDHVSNYSKAINLNPNDKVVSWLPLYHDMGLIAAFHLPLAYGITSVQLNTFEWVLAPVILLDAITREKGTLVWLPNFAYNMLADKIQDDELEDIDLSSVRMFINCSEPVRDESHLKFYERYKNYGLKENSLTVCYAAAETTYAMTQQEPDTPVVKIKADRQQLSKGIVSVLNNGQAGRVCVSSGKPIEGCSVKILDENGNDLADDLVGEIIVKSVSLFDGYRNYPEKTAEAIKDGWYYSGDLGFTHNGYCYVIGRKKDIIIAAGNNVYPEDVEDVVGKIDGVIPGRAVAFGEFDDEIGSEQISVVAETNFSLEDEQKQLRYQVIKAGMQIDVTIKKVYFVPPRWLIKSSAGKPSRKANMERILNNEPVQWS